MKCQVTQQLLPLYVEGDLPRRKSERVRLHLEGCPTCRGLGDEYRSSQKWLHTSSVPVVSGEKLERLRQTVWRRLEQAPRPSPLWLAIERGWMALRRWAGQPAVAVAAVGLVVLGSVTMTRVSGLGGARLGVPTESQGEEVADDNAADLPDDPEILATATPEEMAEPSEMGEPEPAAEESPASKMRIEIQTRDPNVRIIWFTPPAAEAAAVGN
jgi:hypothetical protein